MSEILKQLNNIRSLRAQTRELPLEVLEELLGKLNVVVEERREEERTRLEEQNERQKKLESLRQMLLEDGIDPSELINTSPRANKVRNAREPRPAKYEYKDENGDLKTWTGQGRTPKRIAELLAGGAKLEDFEIQK
ncbi:H-NS histone family protein [Citrobacter freundii]|nr:H-NS histone family protein [Citrobacter freundii]